MVNGKGLVVKAAFNLMRLFNIQQVLDIKTDSSSVWTMRNDKLHNDEHASIHIRPLNSVLLINTIIVALIVTAFPLIHGLSSIYLPQR